MIYTLTDYEKKQLIDIESTYYMKPLLHEFETFLSHYECNQTGIKEAFNNIYNFLIDSKNSINELLELRIDNREIKDIKQTRKSIVGNAFPNIITYIFIKNKIFENIKPNIFITSKKSKVYGFDKVSTIYVDGETQKPDCDLVIFSDKSDKYIILSLKTSLRERAGQTYKWKLLMEIATSENTIKNKYNIHYDAIQIPLICFVTVNFYNEINNPQHRGMFKFFDKVFIAKEIDSVEFVSPLANLIDFVNSVL